MSIEEVEALNPHFKWNRRKQKRRVMSQAKKLANGTYAIGCRGHPGLIQNKTIYPRDIHGSDLEVVSLLDGCEGSCSIYHCCPDPISKEWALWLSTPFNYESNLLSSGLQWLYKFDDFDEHWTVEQHKSEMMKYREKVDLLLSLDSSPDCLHIVEQLQKSYDEIIAGSSPNPVDLGYHGETYRYNRGVHSFDFATEQEKMKLKELGEYNYKNKITYQKL